MLYNIVLVSAIQQGESAESMNINVSHPTATCHELSILYMVTLLLSQFIPLSLSPYCVSTSPLSMPEI